MLKIHNSDRGKKAAEIWRTACILYNLLQIDLSDYPEGNVISKTSRQRRVLKGHFVKTYEYHYENIDIKGKGQFHLPIKSKFKRVPKDKENLWNLRNRIIYRNQVMDKIQFLEKQMKNLLKDINIYKNSREKLDTAEEIMQLAAKAMRHQKDFETCKKQAKKRLLSGFNDENGWNKFFDSNKNIITNLGESVRSKNECLFANKLNELHIYYIYEMIINDEMAPDFTIFVNDEVFYIELLGMMDLEDYRTKLSDKLVKYKKANIVPGENLLLIDMTTGLDMRRIESIITDLFVGKVPTEIVKAG